MLDLCRGIFCTNSPAMWSYCSEKLFECCLSTQLTYYISECWCLGCHSSSSNSWIVKQETHYWRTTLYNLLLANCGVLFHGYISLLAVIVSFIITTCSVVPFRFHHLCHFKQPAAGNWVDFPGATTLRLCVSGYNCCLCTKRSFRLPTYKISRAIPWLWVKTGVTVFRFFAFLML